MTPNPLYLIDDDAIFFEIMMNVMPCYLVHQSVVAL
jgi:hypothetical protein